MNLLPSSGSNIENYGDRVEMKKVLVVENHPDMLEVLTWQMELMGYSVIAARHGKEGVEKALKEKPQLILMDIMMPGMDGREATRMIRANPDTHKIPVLAATVLFRESDLRSCLEAGCNDTITKPFSYQELHGKIQGLPYKQAFSQGAKMDDPS